MLRIVVGWRQALHRGGKERGKGKRLQVITREEKSFKKCIIEKKTVRPFPKINPSFPMFWRKFYDEILFSSKQTTKNNENAFHKKNIGKQTP